MYEVQVFYLFVCFAYGCPIPPAPPIKKAPSSKINWTYLCGCVSEFLVLFLDLCVYPSTKTTLSGQCGCMISLDIVNVILLHNCFGYSKVFPCSYKFQNKPVCIYKKQTNKKNLLDFGENDISLQINLGRTDIFPLLSLPVNEHGMSLQVFRALCQHSVIFLIDSVHVLLDLYLNVLCSLGQLSMLLHLLFWCPFIHCQNIEMTFVALVSCDLTKLIYQFQEIFVVFFCFVL